MFLGINYIAKVMLSKRLVYCYIAQMYFCSIAHVVPSILLRIMSAVLQNYTVHGHVCSF